MKLYDDKLIVVTGGAGFIGSAFLQHLNAKNYTNILVVDNLGTSQKWQNLVGKRFVDFIHKNDFFNWLKGREDQVEAIVHLGACSSTVEPDANYLMENNYRYSLKLAEFALHTDIRFVYASSAATYGDGTLGFSDNHELLDELRPLNMYGYSKHLFDLWAKRQGVLHQMVGLKYFNVFGPNEYHKGRMASAILKMVPQIEKTGKVELFASQDPLFQDGEQKRDFIYVKDVARMTCAFLHNNHTGIFNVGSGKAQSWNELARALFKALKKEEHISYIEMPQDLVGKYQNFTEADTKKLKQALGKEAETISLEMACDDYVNNYLLKSSYL
jgi:ADP-L-glycero-D-manno-heptose 6-epimerase